MEKSGKEKLLKEIFGRRLLLLVNDSELDRSIFRDLLGQEFEAEEASSCREALSFLEGLEQEVALVILEIRMLKADGFRILERLRPPSRERTLPVLLLWDGTDVSALSQAYQMGVTDSVRRPFEGCVVRNRIENILALCETAPERRAKGPVRFLLPSRRKTEVSAASDRTLRLLEHEREKNRFFSALSREVQFEYIIAQDKAIFSEWGAEHLGIPKVIFHPLHSRELHKVLGRKKMLEFSREVSSTHPGEPYLEQKYLLSIDGRPRWYKMIAQVLWGQEEPPARAGIIGKFVDIHEDEMKMNSLENMAAHDALTGLLNPRAVRKKIPAVLEQGQGKTYALVLFDLDDFKIANDRFGHLFGDQVLQNTAKKLSASIRSSDLAARVGGDEFLVFMEYTRNIQAQIRRIFQALTQDFQGFSVSLSMGVALWPENGKNYNELFHCADQALYASKNQGKGTVSFYDASMRSTLSVLSPIESQDPN